MRVTSICIAVIGIVLLASCGGGDGAEGDTVTLRLGYFPNVTHAPAIVGVENGFIRRSWARRRARDGHFNAGTEAIEAMFSGAIDMTYIGPNPAINAFAQSDGEAVRIIAGTTSGGAALVVSEDIPVWRISPGTTLATPSLGNTQDVALRAWLQEQGYETTSRAAATSRPPGQLRDAGRLPAGDIGGVGP